jgi:hypothetical protein
MELSGGQLLVDLKTAHESERGWIEAVGVSHIARRPRARHQAGGGVGAS